MVKQDTLREVKTRMKEMQEAKAAQLETINQKQAEARAQIEAAALGMRQATEEMNVEDYEKAKAAKRRAQSALDMYTERYRQIKQLEYVSEEESDKVIDGLLAYEEKLADDFRRAVAEPLKALAALHAAYIAAVADTESTLTAWQRDIHANYSTRGLTRRTDPLTGEVTDRSETPVLVHRLPFKGCGEAAVMGEYLEKAAPLYDAEG